MSVLRNLHRRTWRERLLWCEAFAALAWAKLLVHSLPFRRLATRLGRAQTETPETITRSQRAIAVEISWAVQAVARHIPLGFVCLPQAIAAKGMLRRRGLPSTLYLGVTPGRARPEAITAHAWLRAGNKIVTGEAEAAQHQVLASFGGDSS